MPAPAASTAASVDTTAAVRCARLRASASTRARRLVPQRRSARVVSAPEPAAATPSSADLGAPTASAPSEATAHHRAAAAPSSTDLEREIALLAQARAQLRAGNAAGAQITLSQMQSQFPDRALHQERQVLKILAQNALGNRESARRSALAFIKAHPESPHDAQLQRMMAQP